MGSRLEQIQDDYFVKTLEELSLEDKNVEKVLMLYELKRKHPSIFKLASDFTTKKEEIEISDEKIFKFFKNKLIEDCVQLYNLMQTKENVTKNSISVKELTERLSKEAKKLKLECEETRKVKEEETKSAKQFIKVFKEYSDLLKDYIEKYSTTFQIPMDQIRADFNCAKVQALCIKFRLDETKKIVKEYGNPGAIERAKATREQLEEENRCLQLRLKEQKSKLAKYESLDPQLLAEYQRLKEDLRCREWAVKQLNCSDCSDEIFL